MKKLKSFFILGALSVILFNSCKNDIALNANYKEIMVVYGLLDNNDSVHYIRIQKAFQNTNATAQSISQNPDSLYFDSLQVKIVDEATNATYALNKEYRIVKDSGYFQNKVNILYKFKAKLDSTHRYRLEAKRVYSGYSISSETAVVGNPTRLISPAGDTVDILPNKVMKLEFFSGINARSYDLFFRLNYNEFDSIKGTLLAQKYVDFYLQRAELTPSLNGGDFFSESMNTEDMLNFIGNSIPPANGIKRVATFLNVCHAGAADDLNVYLDVSKPSIGIVQKKPEYTNIVNGYGVFSSRSVFFKAHPVNWATQKTLREHPATKNLGF